MSNKEESELKVKPSDKAKDDSNDEKSKAKLLVMMHPEIINNARKYFHNENGKTIIEEVVPRGDKSVEEVIMPRTQGDLIDEDFRELAVYASSLVDDTLLKYDQKVAYEDALTRAIGEKDSGRYAGKVNASTFNLILAQMGKNKSKKASETTDVLSVKEKDTQLSDIKTSKEGKKMDKATVQKEIEVTKAKLAALQVLANDGAEKEAAAAKCKKCGGKIGFPGAICFSCQKKDKGGKDKPADKKEEPKKDDKKVEKKDKKEASEEILSNEKLIEALDEIAGSLEEQNIPELMKLAFEIDRVADVLEGKASPESLLEKSAYTISGDKDEGFMKDHFKAGVEKQDADEKFMGEFKTDTSTELRDKQVKGQLGKTASALPYKIVK